MDYAVRSDQGQVREENQDDCLVDINQNGLDILVVADGMGGHNGGAKASSLAVQTVTNYEFTGLNLVEEVEECIKLANSEILQQAQQNSIYQGMGTTLTLAVVKDKQVTIGHIGDSRAYLYQQDQLRQLTDDHSYAGKLLRQGVINAQEAAKHPKRNLLTRALGIREEIEVDSMTLELTNQELLFFCSDGVTEMLSEAELTKIIEQQMKIEDKVDQIIKQANQAGGHDNITALLYQSD
ncbi:Stp1/IreP family PP2C-type Ser/Thr phosphatase [Halanaerobaculum tunisiense]